MKWLLIIILTNGNVTSIEIDNFDKCQQLKEDIVLKHDNLGRLFPAKNGGYESREIIFKAWCTTKG